MEGKDFFAVANELPWANGQPNDDGKDGECVVWSMDKGLWYDIECAKERRFVCRSACQIAEIVMEKNPKSPNSPLLLVSLGICLIGISMLLVELGRRLLRKQRLISSMTVEEISHVADPNAVSL